MKRFLIIALLFACTPVISMAQKVISAQGGSYSNFYGKLDFTVGELVIRTLDNGSNSLTQGFHQTHLVVSSIQDLAHELNVRIYPNPVMYQLTVKFSELQYGKRIEILDLNGKLVKTQRLTAMETTINVQELAAGVYLLRLINKEGQYLKTYQIHKLN